MRGHEGRRDGPVFGAGGRREGYVLGGELRPRFSGRIWRFLRVKLGVVLVGTIARFIDGVPIVTHWPWLTPRVQDVDLGDDSGDSDDSDDSVVRISYDESIPAGGPARLPWFAALPAWGACYFGDHYDGVRPGCDSSETTHSSDSDAYGAPRPARPRGFRVAHRRRVAVHALEEMLRELRAVRGFREVLRAFRALRAAGARPVSSDNRDASLDSDARDD